MSSNTSAHLLFLAGVLLQELLGQVGADVARADGGGANAELAKLTSEGAGHLHDGLFKRKASGQSPTAPNRVVVCMHSLLTDLDESEKKEEDDISTTWWGGKKVKAFQGHPL